MNSTDYVPEFPPSILIDSHMDGRKAYYAGVPYWMPPKSANKEEWQLGWLGASKADRG